jgi:hypothetical protein
MGIVYEAAAQPEVHLWKVGIIDLGTSTPG